MCKPRGDQVTDMKASSILCGLRQKNFSCNLLTMQKTSVKLSQTQTDYKMKENLENVIDQ